MRRPLLLAPVALLGLASCTDFASPAELTKPTVLAIIAEPPLVAPGASAELELVVVGPDGPIEPAGLQWRMIETLPGVPPFGAIEPGDDGTATYTAPDPLPDLPEGAPPLDSVEVTIETDDLTVTAVKVMAVTDLPAANPAITSMVVGEVEASDGMNVVAGVTYPLEVEIDPPAGPDAAYAWYSTVGTIERYQSTPTELVAGGDDGWLFVVVRDGRGGIAVRGVEITVE